MVRTRAADDVGEDLARSTASRSENLLLNVALALGERPAEPVIKLAFGEHELGLVDSGAFFAVALFLGEEFGHVHVDHQFIELSQLTARSSRRAHVRSSRGSKATQSV